MKVGFRSMGTSLAGSGNEPPRPQFDRKKPPPGVSYLARGVLFFRGLDQGTQYPRRSPTSSVGQSAGLSVPRSIPAKTPKTENSNLLGSEVHRPSSKGTKLLFQVIKAIINQQNRNHHRERRFLSMNLAVLKKGIDCQPVAKKLEEVCRPFQICPGRTTLSRRHTGASYQLSSFYWKGHLNYQRVFGIQLHLGGRKEEGWELSRQHLLNVSCKYLMRDYVTMRFTVSMFLCHNAFTVSM